MNRRRRTIWVLAAVAALLVLVELALDLRRGPTATVEIENAGTMPIEDLAVIWRGDRQAVGRVEPGSSARARVSGQGTGPLLLRFRQQGNALGSFEIADFSPARLSGEGLRQVLKLSQNEVERSVDEAEPSLAGRACRAVYRGLGGTPDESLTPQ